MFKNKLSASILAGAMAILGGVGGTALMASAQTSSPTSNTPVVTQSEQATGTADTDSIQSGDQQGPDSVAEKADAPENAKEAVNDPAGGPDVQNQVGDVSGASDAGTAESAGTSK